MDDFNSTFPLQQQDDDNDPHQLLYPPPFTNPSFLQYQQPGTIQMDFFPFESLELDENNLRFNDTTNNNNNQRGDKLRKSLSSAAPLQVEKSSEHDKQIKKATHREIERQRRQEMATLYASLREQLPLENIKGKRSTSDHILEAAKYIEHLQKNVKNLEDKREKLKKASSSSNLDYPKRGNSSATNNDSSPTIHFTVRQCLDGMEILVNSGHENEGFRISRVLEVLRQEGLSIVNCSCTKTKTNSLHTIRAEVGPQVSIDVHVLQQKLADIIQADTS